MAQSGLQGLQDLKELQKKFYQEYFNDESGMIEFEGLMLFKKEGKGNRGKFLKQYQKLDPDQYMKESDVDIYEIFHDGKFNQIHGTLIGSYCGRE